MQPARWVFEPVAGRRGMTAEDRQRLGANFLGALQVQNELGPTAVVATIFCDSNKKYLSTDLLREEPVREGYLSTDIEVLGFRALGRVCAACFDTDARTGGGVMSL